MADFKFGGLICYRPVNLVSEPHDGPVIYLYPCAHEQMKPYNHGLIDIMCVTPYDMDRGCRIEHKDAEQWQPCTHFDD